MLAVILCVVGAALLIFGISIRIAIVLPYYKEQVQKQGDPNRARRNGLLFVGLGSVGLAIGIVIAASR